MSEASSESGFSEPARVWEVTCECGFSAKFRDPDDAEAVFNAHSENYDDGRCGPVSKDAMHAYPCDAIDPEETLPKARMAKLDDVSGAEVFEG